MRKTLLFAIVLLLMATAAQGQSIRRSWMWPLVNILTRLTSLEAEQAALKTRVDNVEQRLDILEATQNNTNIVGLTLLSVVNDVSSLLELQRQEYGARATLFPIGQAAYYADGTSFIWDASHQAEMVAKEQEKALRISTVNSITSQFNVKLGTLTQVELTALQNEMASVGALLAGSIDDIITP